MIKSSFVKKSGLLKILEDPKTIVNQIAKLEKQEASAKKELKALQEGKSRTAWLKSIKQAAEEAEKRLEAIEGQCSTATEQAEKRASELIQEAEERLADAKQKQTNALAKESLVEQAAKKVAKDKASATKLLSEAKQARKDADASKAEWEEKVKDISERLKGIL